MARSPATIVFTSTSELLGKWRSLSEHRPFPVDDVHRDDQQKRDAEKDGRSVRKRIRADVLEERSGRKCKHTSKEVTRPAVSSSRRSRVGAIGADHVVDSGHINSVVGDTDDGRGNHGADPVEWRTS